MKKIFLLSLMLTMVFGISAKPKKQQLLWPDGTEMDAFFSNTQTVDVKSLGKQYVITD